MAGMPPKLIDRANEILQQLESKHVETGDKEPVETLATNVKKLTVPKMQLSIFDAHSETFNEIRTMLDDIDINRLTPVEALMKLNEIKQRVK
jgi:DNA mismatch repair protein MutS